MLERLPGPLRKLVLYGVCGGSGVALDFFLYSMLLLAGVWYQIANIVGYIAGTLLSFVLNRAITFQVRDAPLRRLAMFLGVAAIGYTLSIAILWLLVDQLAVGPLMAKAVSLVAVVVTQFGLNYLITFRSATSDARKTSAS